MTADRFGAAATSFRALQGRIVDALQQADPSARFVRDAWQRSDPVAADGAGSPRVTGGGVTCIVEGGALLERGGVGFTEIEGQLGPDVPAAMPGEGMHFRATGVSLVLHPRNPHVPIVHMNYRRIERGARGWFGGGTDLTPCYLHAEDARHFHGTLREVCDRHGAVAPYPTLKRDCDAYFDLPHRGERRGIGGIFFDLLDSGDDRDFAFVRDAGAAFLPAWLPLATRRQDTPYGPNEVAWQQLRRGRHVEFNLLWDRGTTFGLKTGGRIESILLSMPPQAAWRYDYEPAADSAEAALLEVLRLPRDWT